MKRILLSLVIVVGVLGGTRAARACGSGGDYGALVGAALVVGAVDVGFTAYDLTQVGQGKPGSRVAGAFEVLLVGPQAGLITYAALQQPNSTSIGFAVWLDLLALHGAYALFRPGESAPPPAGITMGTRGKRQVTFMPTVVSDGKAIGSGVGAVGYF